MANVYWITGLSGAGKTTIGQIFFEKLKVVDPATVFLDGDTLRQAFGGDLGYSETDRRKCAMRYSRLCKLLSEQGISVVICTISMFESVREWNRKHIENYREIYVKVSMDILRKRDQKGLYSGNTDEQDTDIAGLQIAVEEPAHPDLILENDGDVTPSEQADKIMKYVTF